MYGVRMRQQPAMKGDLCPKLLNQLYGAQVIVQLAPPRRSRPADDRPRPAKNRGTAVEMSIFLRKSIGLP
ncbi:hypothetical protein B0G82_5192 [Paraburkholderia sp. BL17N1]|nr:hypothetical protein B0G82_5192 [Paraburkholderia sp. BL17N1]